MNVLLSLAEEQMAKDIVSFPLSDDFQRHLSVAYLVWRIHELAEEEFEQGRFRRRRYRQQMHNLQMQTSSIHHPIYAHQPIPPFYPTSSNNSYYNMCSSTPSIAYSTNYTNSNPSSEITSASPPPPNYPFYDPYSTSYYPAHYHSMTSSYASPNQSLNFES